MTAHVDRFVIDGLPPAHAWPDLSAIDALGYSERMNCATVLVDEIAERTPDRAAVHTRVDGAVRTASYAQLRAQANRLAHVLVDDFGLVPGNRVLLRGGNSPMLAALWLATMKAGLVAVPTMPLLRAREIGQVVDKAQVQVAIGDAALLDELLALRDRHPSMRRIASYHGPDGIENVAARKPDRFDDVATRADDPALLAFTSGTTGVPKATVHFHRDVIAMCDLFPRHVLGMTADDVTIGTPPLAFTFGLGGLLCFPLRHGASAVLCERYTPESLLEAITAFKPTVSFTAPTFYRAMAQVLAAAPARRFDVSSLRHCVSAGEALPDATRTLWREASGVDITDGIGATEMIHIFIASCGGRAGAPVPRGFEVKRGALGKPVPGYEVRVVDDDLREVPNGTVGKLAVRGPTGCRYLADERQSNYVRDGWNFPGDAFVRDDDGYLYYQARADDMIISAGYNIAGPEVEAALLGHEAVAECGVVGIPDPERGQRVKAFVVLKAGHVPDAALVERLQAFVKRTIAPYKYPREIEFVEALPRTETGKLQRFRLRETPAHDPS